MNKAIFCSVLGVWLMMQSVSYSSIGAEYVAMVMDIRSGTVTYAEGPLEDSLVEIGSFLNQKDQIKIGQAAILVLNYFETSTREEIRGPARIEITTAGSKPIEEQAGQIKKDKIAYKPPKAVIESIQLRSCGTALFRDVGFNKNRKYANSAIPILSLSDTSVITRESAVLRWHPIQDAEKYVFKLFDSQNKLKQKNSKSDSAVRINPKHLYPGMAYHWTLEALKAGNVVEQAGGKFDLLTQAESETVMAIKNSIQQRFPGDSTEGLLLLNLLYEGYGLKDDAEPVLLKLRQLHPQNSVFINQLRNLNPALLVSE